MKLNRPGVTTVLAAPEPNLAWMTLVCLALIAITPPVRAEEAKSTPPPAVLDLVEGLVQALDQGSAREDLIHQLRSEAEVARAALEAARARVEALEEVRRALALPDPDGPTRSAELVVTDEDRDFWSFLPLSKAEPPPVKNQAWCRTEVDRFILARLEQAGLAPAPEANRRTLIRRLYFDLIGLPPPPEEVEAILADKSDEAYDKAVDRLLADPHFGERWGRHWLDLARYADSDGYEFDKERPTAYPYRDAVIRAMNEDLPFDTFLKWQLAGDEIEPDNPLARALTGFCASGPTIDNQVLEKNHYDELDDILVTTCSSMLALTVGCARCHDHKFEPISMRDYYRMLAFFNTTKREEIHLATRIEADAARKREGELTKRQVEARAALDQFVSPFRTPIFESKLASLPINATEQNLLRAPEDPANPPQRMLLDLYRQAIRVTDDELVASMTESMQIRWETLKEAVANLEKELAELPTKCLTVTDSQAEPLPAYFLARGDPDQKQGEVQPGFLSVLRRIGAEERPVHIPVPDGAVTTLRRRALAEWITDVESGAGHLAARVIVNRLWRHHFGEGLVRTPSDFGMQGDRPSHPELLDWLAGELIRGGWKLKRIHRLLTRSSVYRLGTEFDEGKAAQDPENRLLWRRRPVRLEAEPIRDAILAVSGKLNDEMYGPGIHPRVPREAIATGSTYKWPVDVVDGPDTWRRSIYIFVRRSAVFPMLTVFDGTDATASCARRTATTVPLQALELLNNDFAREQAGYFVERARARVDGGTDAWVREVFEIALSRPPSQRELETARGFLNAQSNRHEASPDTTAPTRRALTDFCQALMNLNEFVYVD